MQMKLVLVTHASLLTVFKHFGDLKIILERDETLDVFYSC